MKSEESPCVADLIVHGNQDPDSPAIESPGYEPLTYRDLREQVTYIVRTLNAMGFRPNDRIAIVMPNGPETAVATISVMAGFTAVPLNLDYKEQEFAGYFSHLEIKAVLVQKGSDTAAIITAEAHNIPIIEVSPRQGGAGMVTLVPEADITTVEAKIASSKDTAVILQTSGTTSQPKIVPVTQERFFRGIQLMNAKFDLTRTDKNLHFVPFDTGFGIAHPLWGPLFAGGTVICLRNFIASDFVHLLNTYRPTYYWGAPAHHKAILEELQKIPPGQPAGNSLRFIATGSAVSSPDIHRGLESLLGVRMVEAYVMSEAFISLNIPHKEGSVGIPFVRYLEIWDDNNIPVQHGTTGEIVVKGELIFDGYENAPLDNAESFRDGWFRTGDMGYLDDEGYLFLTGRKKEMINKGGRKIAPAEIDAVLLSHPGVRDAMAFRIPDPVLGEDIAVLVVKKDSRNSEEELRQFCLDHMVQYKVPCRICFVNEIPRNTLGKPLREEGTQQYMREVHPRDQTGGILREDHPLRQTMEEEKLLQIWKDVLDVQDISPDDDFFQSGGNSLDAIHLLIRIQREYHINLPADTIYRHPTIRQQAVLVAEKNKRHIQYHPLIVPIRNEGVLPPLFCVHPIDGWVGHYKDLAKCLSSNRPIYGIRAQGWETTEIPFTSVEEAAQEYIRAIKTVQETGPYHCIGFSGGAPIVYELACQFRKKGEMIAFLGLVDQSAPAPEVQAFKTITTVISPTKSPPKIPYIAYKGFKYFKNYKETHPDSRIYSVFVRLMRTVSKAIIHISGPKSPSVLAPSVTYSPETEKFLTSTFPPEQQPLVRAIMKTVMNYVPSDYIGDVILFSTGPDNVFFPGDQTRGWGSHIRGNVTVIDVPGNHNNLFKDEYCRVLAGKIEETLSTSNGLQ
jgi:acyl-CoA synthetase (AMP-forming)/AMP-acid ligase II/thioesterase domain-containing protein/acyl carrier protein